MAVGLFLLIFGNAFLDSAAQGVRASYIEKYTGDLFVASVTRLPITVFGSGGGPGGGAKIVPIGNFPTLQKLLDSSELVDHWNGHSVSIAQILVHEQAKGMAQLLGIDPVQYTKTFPKTVVFEEGGFWKSGEHGFVINRGMVNTIREKSGVDIKVGDTLSLSVMGESSKIRDAVLTGISVAGNSQGPLSFIGWCDIDTLRLLKGQTVEAAAAQGEPSSVTLLDEDSLFSLDKASGVQASSGIDLNSVLTRGLGARKPEVADPGAWEFVTLRLKAGVPVEQAQRTLGAEFRKAGLEVQVQDWVAGAGNQAQTVLALKSAFNIVILIIALVALFIVMNALMISVSERTTEIGTMRALGGRRRLVRNMILLEVFFLSLGAGALGLAVSFLGLGVLWLTGVPLGSFFLQMLFASDHIKPLFSLSSALASWVQLIAVGLLAGWYPAHVALKLSPLKAIQID